MAALFGAFDSPHGYWNYLKLSLEATEESAPWRDQYRLLKAYMLNNGLYDVLYQLFRAKGYARQDISAIRNPAGRVVEFYAAKTWPGALPNALPIETENQRIVEPIQQIWTWSNWSNEKQAAVRLAAACGDMFLKASSAADSTGRPSRVYIQTIDPEHVSYFERDERNIVTLIRLDIPKIRIVNRQEKRYTHTEVWTKADYSVWEHDKGLDAKLDDLGDPTRTRSLAEFGIDFVPFVWQPFRHYGEERGVGSFTLATEKIDEANRQAHRLAHLLFRNNRTVWALLSNSVDREGRPIPPPKITTGGKITVEDGEDPILSIPGGTLTALVPAINYADALAVLQDQMHEVKSDLPELAYYDLRDQGQLSGRAVRMLLSDAVDRLLEARGNLEYALMRADQMCLTLGANLGLFGGIGTYDAGDFDHTFRERDPFPADDLERAQTFQTYAGGGMPVQTAAKLAGLPQETLDEMATELAADREREVAMIEASIASARPPLGEEETDTAPPSSGRGNEGEGG